MTGLPPGSDVIAAKGDIENPTSDIRGEAVIKPNARSGVKIATSRERQDKLAKDRR